MEKQATVITIETTINAPVEKVWNNWTSIEDLKNWNTASPDWHTPKAAHDLKPGGHFVYRMEAKDGSFGFDFSGVFDEVQPNKYLAYTIGDGRKVAITFTSNDNTTTIVESFEAEAVNSLELQQNGWQAILDSFKQYVEAQN